MKKIIKQIKEHEIYNIVTRIHNNEDIDTGDLVERLENYEYYNHIADFDISNFDLNSHFVDDDIVDDIIYEIEENGIKKIPKVIINDEGDIIDGLHRLNAFIKLGINNIDLLIGTNIKHVPKFKKELIDENLKIYKISNEFGSISIMEDAKYSPADNSVFEFLVDEQYRSLGVGTELLKEAMKQYDNLGAQISSLASLKVFLECGFEPNETSISQQPELELTSFDFKTFNKAPELLEGNAAMYRQSITCFRDKIKESIDLFLKNGQSLYLNDTRKNNIKLKNNRRKVKL